MQITEIDKQNKIEIKSSISKLWIVYIMLILGVGILVALYINFQLTYKVDDINQKISKLDYNRNKDTEINTTTSSIIKKDALTKELKTYPPKEKESLLDISPISYNIIQDFYIMKSKAEKGDNFTDQLLSLEQYTITSDELKTDLNNLLKLSSNNKKRDYFKLEFNKIIRALYQRPHNSNLFNINDYIFIRPTGERAIANGGLDQQIALIEQALIENNLKQAYEYLQELPQDINSVNTFKLDIKNQLAIQDGLTQIESILLDKQYNNIVGK